MRKLLKITLTLLLGAGVMLKANAQHNENFVVGDAAPPIKYSKWLKGTPVTSYKRDHLYVIECWATWCGPCIAAMPHLSELAAQYKDKATFIGMNVWEKIPETQSYETVLPGVSKFVTSLGDKMAYDVAVDNGDRYFAKEWLAKAKARGIPTTFLVKNGKLIWIGHPIKLDDVLVKIMAGSYDVEQARKDHLLTIANSTNASEKERIAMEPIEAAIKAKQYNKAFALMDTLIAKDPVKKYVLNIHRFNILLDSVEQKQAIAFAEDWKNKDGERITVNVAQSIIERKGLSREVYIYAAEAFNKGSGGSMTANPMYYDFAAKAYSLAGDYANAVALQGKAVEVARESVKAGRHVGVIHDYTITEYEAKLRDYQQQINSKK